MCGEVEMMCLQWREDLGHTTWPSGFIRVVPPELSQEFATSHDKSLWRCLSAVLGVPPTLCNPRVRDTITLPLAFGGMGLRSASRTAIPAILGELG